MKPHPVFSLPPLCLKPICIPCLRVAALFSPDICKIAFASKPLPSALPSHVPPRFPSNASGRKQAP